MELLKNNHGLAVLALGFLAMVQGSNIDLTDGVRRLVGKNDDMRRESIQGNSGRRLSSKKEGPLPPQEPTLAPEPTDLWNVVTGENGNVITTCKVLPEGNSTTNMLSKVLSFDYNLYLSEIGDADVESQIAAVEAKSHEALTPMLLPCSFVDDDTIVAALSSEPADELVGECQSNSTSPCWQVRAQMTIVMSSALSDPELLALLYPYLEESLATAVDDQNIVDIEFVGVVGGGLDDGQALPATDITNPSGTASAMHGNMALTASPAQGLGPTAIAIAAIVLVLLSAFLIQRHRRRQALFRAQSRRDTSDVVKPPPTIERKHKVALMNDREFLGQGDNDGLEVVDEESRQRI